MVMLFFNVPICVREEFLSKKSCVSLNAGMMAFVCWLVVVASFFKIMATQEPAE